MLLGETSIIQSRNQVKFTKVLEYKYRRVGITGCNTSSVQSVFLWENYPTLSSNCKHFAYFAR